MRRFGRFLVAVLATAVVVGGAYAAWTYGLARFDDDYCLQLDELPADASRISAPEWEFPLTYRCDYGPAGVVTVNEPIPLAATAALGGVTVLLVSAIWWRLATGSPAPEYEGQHRA